VSGHAKSVLRNKHGVLFIIGLLMMLSLVACSSDNSTGTAPATPGDPDSPEYQSVSRVLGSEAFALEGLHWHSLLESVVPGAARSRTRTAAPAHDTVLSVTVTVDSASGWIVINALAAHHEDTATILDSVRFYRNGVPTIPSQDLPPDSMSAVDVRIRGHVHANDSTDFVGDLEHASWINLEVLDRDPGLATVTYQLSLAAEDTLDGTAWDSVWGTCDVHVAAHRTITDLIEIEESSSGPPARGAQASVWKALAAHEGCPLAGTVRLDMDVDLACTGGLADVTVDAQWTVQATFDGGQYVRLTFTSGGFYWNEEVDCSELSEL
jgi:hypothetical protein